MGGAAGPSAPPPPPPLNAPPSHPRVTAPAVGGSEASRRTAGRGADGKVAPKPLRLSRPFQLVWADSGAEVYPLHPSTLAALTYVAPERTLRAPSFDQEGVSAAGGAEGDAAVHVVDDIDAEEHEAADVLHVALGEDREGGGPGGVELGGESK